MSRQCSVCLSIRRREIDEQVVAGASNRSIALQFGVGSMAVQRHKAHIPPTLSLAREVDIVDFADSLLAGMRDLLADLDDVVEKTRSAGDQRTRVLANRERLRTMMVLVEMDRQKALQAPVDLLSTPNWREIRERIVAAFHDDPAARLKLADTLAEFEVVNDIA